MNFCYILFVVCQTWHVIQSSHPDQRVLLGDVKVLTLYKGRYTRARRVSPISQIKCIGGTAKCVHALDVINCYNRGSDGIDIQWECTTDIPKQYKLGRFDVLCEGYDDPNDPYILIGSCGLEYNLDLANNSSEITTDAAVGIGMILLIIFSILLVVICVAACSDNSDDQSKKNETKTNDSLHNKNHAIESKLCVNCNKAFNRKYENSESNIEYTCDACIERQNSTNVSPSVDNNKRSTNYGGTKRR